MKSNTTRDPEHTTRLVVDGVELTVAQDGNSVTVKRVVARDRKRKRNVTCGITFDIRRENDPPAIALVKVMKGVVKMQTARCDCDYRYGYSDHAEHCRSIYVAESDGACVDDD
jgi:hypothetical protein